MISKSLPFSSFACVQVAGAVRNRSSEMVEALYSMNRVIMILTRSILPSSYNASYLTYFRLFFIHEISVCLFGVHRKGVLSVKNSSMLGSRMIFPCSQRILSLNSVHGL